MERVGVVGREVATPDLVTAGHNLNPAPPCFPKLDMDANSTVTEVKRNNHDSEVYPESEQKANIPRITGYVAALDWKYT